MADGYDLIVIGSGSGGAPVARRLADAGARVCVIEAGGDPKGDPMVEDPAQWFGLQSGRWDWGHAYRPSAALNGRVVPIPRGKALGGSSVTNAMMWYRGVPADYDRWNAVAPGWSWEDCLPAFRACETWAPAADAPGGRAPTEENAPDAHALRGTKGPLHIARGIPDHPLTQAMLAGGAAMGLPLVDDPNGPEAEGVALANFNIDPDGKRHTSADAYLRPLMTAVADDDAAGACLPARPDQTTRPDTATIRAASDEPPAPAPSRGASHSPMPTAGATMPSDERSDEPAPDALKHSNLTSALRPLSDTSIASGNGSGTPSAASSYKLSQRDQAPADATTVSGAQGNTSHSSFTSGASLTEFMSATAPNPSAGSTGNTPYNASAQRPPQPAAPLAASNAATVASHIAAQPTPALSSEDRPSATGGAERFTTPYSTGQRNRLTVLTHTRALAILFEGIRAVGVRITGPEGLRDLYADRIVLAAGALETPRLLMLSGIGPADELQRFGLAIRVDAPEVGRNLQDHPLLRALNMRPNRPLGPPLGNGGGTLTIWRSDPTLAQADLLAFPIQNASGGPALRERYDLGGEAFAIGLGVMRSYSRGWMRLTGTDPDAPLEIEPNLLGDPRDLKALITGVQQLQEMLEGPGFSDLFAGHLAPDRRLSPEDAEDFIRLACSTFFHCTGTARMGADDLAVCDPRLKVNGLENLWIADASVIPDIPACHTHAPVTMIGERAASFLKDAACPL